MIVIEPMITLPDFNTEDFDCRCGCGLNNMKPVFLWKLQQCRTEANVPFIVTSGSRCKTYNKSVGGKLSSEHLTGEAVDIVVQNSTVRFKIVRAAIEVGFRRVGIGKDFIHLGGSDYAPQQIIWLY